MLLLIVRVAAVPEWLALAAGVVLFVGGVVLYVGSKRRLE